MTDVSVYAQAKLLFNLLNPTDALFDYVELEGKNLRINAAYVLSEEEQAIVKMLMLGRL
jgi:hypothetical protein